MLLFILISWNIAGVVRYFNTSHVTVYRKLHCARNVKNSNFNTSHVTVYRIRSLRRGCIIFDFNTSHVTVYPNSGSCSSHVSGFQYISCYCLSECFCFFHISLRHFNTSHVTVYPSQTPEWLASAFHFNTSHVTVYPYAALVSSFIAPFQYISCYCLSLSGLHCHQYHTDFNTSHVTVYRVQRTEAWNRVFISIHLMLLFI